MVIEFYIHIDFYKIITITDYGYKFRFILSVYLHVDLDIIVIFHDLFLININYLTFKLDIILS